MASISELRKKEALNFVTAIESQVEKKFEGYKNLSYNANTKGYDYEFAIFKIFKDYLGSRFNFYLRPHIIDREMKYLEILNKGENEVDIAATFKSTTPRVILKTDKTNFVFFNSIAFLVECKAILNLQSLSNDLNKLKKIAALPVNPKRFTAVFGPKYAVKERPLRILVYHRRSIKDQSLESVLAASIFWDIIFVVNKKITIVNKSTVPFAKNYLEKSLGKVSKSQISYWRDVPFMALILMILESVPEPLTVNLMNDFGKLVSTAYSNS